MNKVSCLANDVLAESHREVSRISANVVFFLVCLSERRGEFQSKLILSKNLSKLSFSKWGNVSEGGVTA